MYSANIFSRGAGRLLIVLAVLAITLTVMGMADLGKDAFGSHNDIAFMSSSDFRDGDIVHLNITETLGCAATVETTEYTLHIFKTNQYDSAYYFVVPYYTEEKGGIPDRIILFKTGNRNQAETLEDLTYETVSWYLGQASDTYSHLRIDRAEVKAMNSEETSALRDYLDRFVEAYYDGSGSDMIARLKAQYSDAIVPYVVQYRAKSGSTVLPVGLVMLGILIVVIIIIVVKNKNTSSVPEFTYIGAKPPAADPNLNSPTGLSNATGTMFGSNTVKVSPAAPVQPTGYRENYNNSVRPLPPMNTGATPVQPQKRRIENFDPFTGKPVRAKQTLMESVLATPPVRSNRPDLRPKGDSMPSVVPGSEENVDLSNGGVLPEDKAKYFAAMPKNGNIPVVNPESLPAAGMFGGVPLTAEALSEPEHDETAAVSEVSPIHPPTSRDNLAVDIQVEQTDPSARNIYGHIAGGEMNEVDPYTEKNVDISNGGIELPDEDDGIRRDFPTATPFTVPFTPPPEPVPAPQVSPAAVFEPSPAEKTVSAPEVMPSAAAPVMSEIRTDFPSADTTFSEPKQPDSYNIFKTDSSYNIFKTDDKKDEKKEGTGGIGSMGFPVENKDFPKVDTSFPTAGESDIGGKDDFVF